MPCRRPRRVHMEVRRRVEEASFFRISDRRCTSGPIGRDQEYSPVVQGADIGLKREFEVAAV